MTSRATATTTIPKRARKKYALRSRQPHPARIAVLVCQMIMWRLLWPLFDRGIVRRLTPHREPRRRAMQTGAQLAERGKLQPGERVWVVGCEGVFPFNCRSGVHQALAARSVREAWARLECQGWYLQRTRRAAGTGERPICPECILWWMEEFAPNSREVDERDLVWSR